MLAIYSCGSFCSIAIKTEYEKFELYSNEQGQHSKLLYTQYDTLLRQANIDHSDIKIIITCTGPGSFTGIRCGLAFAFGFRLIYKHIKLAGYSALEILAHKHNTLNPVVLVRPNFLYEQTFNQNGSQQHEIKRSEKKDGFSIDEINANDLLKIAERDATTLSTKPEPRPIYT